MTISEQNTATGQNVKAPRQPTRGGRMLSVVHGKDERSLHLSPILQQIKDDGPALIDGEVVKEAGAAPRLAKSAANADTKAPAAPMPSMQPLLADKQVKVLLGFCAALALGLCASLYFAWQQQQRLANVEYMLEVLVTSPR
ncbi:MAG: hypothetical protein SV422_02030 [Pseudomonadota bacterium]|nr:hypothetical protein [Pseudomonadota bacterium]